VGVVPDGFFHFARTSGLIGSAIHRADRLHPKLSVPPIYRSAPLGQPQPVTRVSLRRDPGDVGLIALGLDPLPPTTIPGVEGLLLTLPVLVVANAVHDGNGLVEWTIPRIQPYVAPGLMVHSQGVSQDASGRYFLSNRGIFRLYL